MPNTLFTILDELAVDVVRVGRELAEAARDLQLEENSEDAGLATRAFSRLRERKPLDDTDIGGLEAVREIIEADIAHEVIGIEARFFPTDIDECGPIGETREVPVYTERGEGLIKLKELFKRFLNARATLFDHLAAHQLLNEQMVGR